MSKLKTYKVDLRPMDVFFFGGEQHFGEGDETNYFVRSNYFPQQSGILGMLRHQLLIQNDCIPVKGKEALASELIGSESYNLEGKELKFGAIQQISPLFISKEPDLLFPEASEFYIKKKDDFVELLQFNPKVFTDANQTMIYPDLAKPSIISAGKDYLGKYELPDMLVSLSGKQFRYNKNNDFEKKGNLPENGVFIETGKPGIQKTARREKGQKDNGFYRQYSYSFPEGVCFTFFAEIDRDVARNFESGRIMLGGEKSAFHMVVKEFDGEGSPFDENSKFYSGLYQRPHSSLHKIVCLSDCIVSDVLSAKVAFMSNTMIDFRNSRSKVKHTTNYNRMTSASKSQTYESPTRSEKYQLLKRGSVLWVDDTHLKSVQDLLNKEQHRTIGYNYFKTIQKQ
jgi:CRISPR-associated protein Cmr3